MNSSSSSDGGMMMCFNNNNSYSYGRSPFTLSQWQELEHLALIFKYMVASLPVPPDLVLLIHNSFHSISQSFLQRPSVGYCSFYEKKVDPEPGRCRRTDGKKWRCSKEAHPASKYCERHMHRGRNRSRKLVESQTMAQSSSTLTSLTATGGSSGTGNFQNHPTNAFANLQASGSGTSYTKYQLDSVPCGIPSKEYRYLQGSNKVHQMESQLENTWPLMSTGVASFSTWKSSCNSMLQSDYPRHSFLSSEYASRQPVKQEDRPLRPFLNEWPKGRESWSGPEDERSNQTALPATQLSISSPMSSPDFSATCSQSPHGEI